MPRDLEKRKEYKKEWYEKNREQIKERKKEYYEKNKDNIKEYAEKNKEKIKEYNKEYAEKNKEQKKQYNKEYAEKNKEQIKERRREYREKNKEKIKEYMKEYNQTPQRKKGNTICRWKLTGVISDDYSSLYDYYLNCKNCEECDVELVSGNFGSNFRCLDHDHTTGEFRNILCHTCNLRRH
jgi:AAA15 family ATPase/GTPase